MDWVSPTTGVASLRLGGALGSSGGFSSTSSALNSVPATLPAWKDNCSSISNGQGAERHCLISTVGEEEAVLLLPTFVFHLRNVCLTEEVVSVGNV